MKPDEPYFNTGVYDQLDRVAQTIHESKLHLECISRRLSTMIDPKKGGCKFDKNDKIGYFLFCTKNRSKTLLNRFKNMPEQCINIRDDTGNIIYKLDCDSFTFWIVGQYQRFNGRLYDACRVHRIKFRRLGDGIL